MILKPADLSPAEHAWQADILPTITADGFRLAMPLRASNGSLVVDGWAATAHLRGEHRPGSWPEIIEVGARLHRALQDVGRPGFLDARTDPWSMGDRVAWGEAPIETYRSVPYVDRLAAILVPIDTRCQLVHGDLTGNVLFADRLPPAIIDLSPYWRPTAFATAVVVADALVWEGADASLVRQMRHVHGFDQYLARALIFRLVSASVGRSEGDDRALEEVYGPAVQVALADRPATDRTI